MYTSPSFIDRHAIDTCANINIITLLHLQPAAAAALTTTSAGLTMRQMWQMPRASDLRRPPEVEKFFSARQ